MNKPLVILTRAESDNHRIAPFFKEQGMETLSIPLIEIRDLPITPWELPDISTPCIVLLTSSRATTRWLAFQQEIINRVIHGYLVVGQHSAQRLRESDPDTPVLMVEDSTEELLEDVITLRRTYFDPERIASAETDQILGEGSAVATILYPCSARRREEGVTGFTVLGFTVVEIPLYEPICPQESTEQLFKTLADLPPSTTITFFSPSAAEHFFEILLSKDETGMLLLKATKHLLFAAIGETTADTLYERGIEEVIVPVRPDAQLLAEEIARHWQEAVE